MERSIKLLGVETNPNGKPFNRYKTNEGNMTSWDDKGANEQLMRHLMQWVVVDIEEKPGKDGKTFKNIMKFIRAGEEPKQSTSFESTPNSPSAPSQLTSSVVELREKAFKTTIKQTSKGFHYYEVTVKADTFEELENNQELAVNCAEKTCKRLNDLISLTGSDIVKMKEVNNNGKETK